MITKTLWAVIFTIAIFFIMPFYVPVSADICTSGTSSLINIPVAQVTPHEYATIGLSYINHAAAWLSRGKFNNYPVYFSMGILPRLELSAGVVFVPGRKSYDGTSTYKDAVISIQYVFVREKKWLPAIAIGIRDFYSYMLQNTSYLILSRHIIHNPWIKAQIHAGYGSDVMKHHHGVPEQDRRIPVGHTIVGYFGGLSVTLYKRLMFLLEYDSTNWNAGMRIPLFHSLSAELSLMHLRYVSGGIQWAFHL